KLGKEVLSNDFMHFPHMYNLATIENKDQIITEDQLLELLQPNPNKKSFIADTFRGLYFTEEENNFLDNTRYNIDLLPNKYLRAIALSALVRSCLKKRPRGIFTYVGNRYDDGRKDLKKELQVHFIENIQFFNE